MRRAFRTKTFTRRMRNWGLTDEMLHQAVLEMAEGLVDANLGGNVLKKRVARPGGGKRGGTRTLVATGVGDRWFFLFGFAKNERADIDRNELKALREIAKDLLLLDDKQINTALRVGEITEILG